MEALRWGANTALWIFSSIVVGYIAVPRWWYLRSQGHHEAFPVGQFLLAVALTLGLIWFYTYPGPNVGDQRESAQPLPTYINRLATATAKAVQTVEAGGVLPTLTPRPTRAERSSTSISTPIPSSTWAEILAEGLNVRDGPSAEHAVVTVLHKGDRVSVIAVDPETGWLQVQLPTSNITGWISGSSTYVTVSTATPPP